MKPHKHAELIKAWADGAEPLYTGFKQLTDEEIMEVITMSHSWIDGYPKKYALEFARAILRKAQEK